MSPLRSASSTSARCRASLVSSIPSRIAVRSIVVLRSIPFPASIPDPFQYPASPTFRGPDRPAGSPYRTDVRTAIAKAPL